MRAHVICALALGVSGLLMTGCLDRDLKPLNPCTVSGVVEKVSVSNVEKVDMLFMIDNSNSMTEEQTSLAVELPSMMTVLATGDSNGDGEQDFPPVKNLHVGVVTSDMGTGGFTVPTCSEPNFGDDGILRTQGNTAITGCMATYPNFLEFRSDSGADPATFARDFTCVAQMGTGGCGFEQQLEAVLKAITPATSPTRFVHGTTGHGDGANAGFVREDSALAIIVLSDEGDCSVADTDLFDPDSSEYPGNLSLRCTDYPDALHPVQRYVDGLLALRPDGERLSYTLIGGVPTDLSGADPDTILADDRMVLRVDPEDPNRLAPSCNEPGRGLAFPPRRMVQVAGDLADAGAQTEVRSICDADFFPALTAALDRIWVTLDQAGNRCLATGD